VCLSRRRLSGLLTSLLLGRPQALQHLLTCQAALFVRDLCRFSLDSYDFVLDYAKMKCYVADKGIGLSTLVAIPQSLPFAAPAFA
jgi:hypothetical protein